MLSIYLHRADREQIEWLTATQVTIQSSRACSMLHVKLTRMSHICGLAFGVSISISISKL